jgi:hypothetical protein
MKVYAKARRKDVTAAVHQMPEIGRQPPAAPPADDPPQA